MTPEGLSAPCKPKEQKMLQREQLEANKVYNSCIEGQDKGVNYDYAQVWRIVKGERIDFGSVAGRFIAREFPTWEETQPNNLKHDRPGIVSVRKGSDSGFSFTITPAGNTNLNESHIVIGQVLEGMDVVEALNNVPVVKAAKGANYMALTGGAKIKEAPTRSCLYGGDMYCSENKPLVKLVMYNTGIL
jgi:cyclophilin family peptidyl-prolyl cis-trans isomerase